MGLGQPTSKAECLRKIDHLTAKYQQCQSGIQACQLNIITNPQWKQNYKSRIQSYKAEAASIKAEISKYKAYMKNLK